MDNKRVSRKSEPFKHGKGDESLEFVGLLTSHQHRIYAYILTLIPDWGLAEDILQETSMVMWVKYPDIRPIENFTAWAIRIAHNKILNYLTKKEKQAALFPPETLEEVAQQTEQVCRQMDQRVSALKTCMSQLSQTDRQYLRLRYEGEMTIKQVAEKVGKPVQGMYKRMARLHERLMDCIQRRMAAEVSFE